MDSISKAFESTSQPFQRSTFFHEETETPIPLTCPVQICSSVGRWMQTPKNHAEKQACAKKDDFVLNPFSPLTPITKSTIQEDSKEDLSRSTAPSADFQRYRGGPVSQKSIAVLTKFFSQPSSNPVSSTVWYEQREEVGQASKRHQRPWNESDVASSLEALCLERPKKRMCKVAVDQPDAPEVKEDNIVAAESEQVVDSEKETDGQEAEIYENEYLDQESLDDRRCMGRSGMTISSVRNPGAGEIAAVSQILSNRHDLKAADTELPLTCDMLEYSATFLSQQLATTRISGDRECSSQPNLRFHWKSTPAVRSSTEGSSPAPSPSPLFPSPSAEHHTSASHFADQNLSQDSHNKQCLSQNTVNRLQEVVDEALNAQCITVGESPLLQTPSASLPSSQILSDSRCDTTHARDTSFQCSQGGLQTSLFENTKAQNSVETSPAEAERRHQGDQTGSKACFHYNEKEQSDLERRDQTSQHNPYKGNAEIHLRSTRTDSQCSLRYNGTKSNNLRQFSQTSSEQNLHLSTVASEAEARLAQVDQRDHRRSSNASKPPLQSNQTDSSQHQNSDKSEDHRTYRQSDDTLLKVDLGQYSHSGEGEIMLDSSFSSAEMKLQSMPCKADVKTKSLYNQQNCGVPPPSNHTSKFTSEDTVTSSSSSQSDLTGYIGELVDCVAGGSIAAGSSKSAMSPSDPREGNVLHEDSLTQPSVRDQRDVVAARPDASGELTEARSGQSDVGKVGNSAINGHPDVDGDRPNVSSNRPEICAGWPDAGDDHREVGSTRAEVGGRRSELICGQVERIGSRHRISICHQDGNIGFASDSERRRRSEANCSDLDSEAASAERLEAVVRRPSPKSISLASGTCLIWDECPVSDARSGDDQPVQFPSDACEGPSDDQLSEAWRGQRPCSSADRCDERADLVQDSQTTGQVCDLSDELSDVDPGTPIPAISHSARIQLLAEHYVETVEHDGAPIHATPNSSEELHIIAPCAREEDEELTSTSLSAVYLPETTEMCVAQSTQIKADDAMPSSCRVSPVVSLHQSSQATSSCSQIDRREDQSSGTAERDTMNEARFLSSLASSQEDGSVVDSQQDVSDVRGMQPGSDGEGKIGETVNFLVGSESRDRMDGSYVLFDDNIGGAVIENTPSAESAGLQIQRDLESHCSRTPSESIEGGLRLSNSSSKPSERLMSAKEVKISGNSLKCKAASSSVPETGQSSSSVVTGASTDDSVYLGQTPLAEQAFIPSPAIRSSSAHNLIYRGEMTPQCQKVDFVAEIKKTSKINSMNTVEGVIMVVGCSSVDRPVADIRSFSVGSKLEEPIRSEAGGRIAGRTSDDLGSIRKRPLFGDAVAPCPSVTVAGKQKAPCTSSGDMAMGERTPSSSEGKTEVFNSPDFFGSRDVRRPANGDADDSPASSVHKSPVSGPAKSRADSSPGAGESQQPPASWPGGDLPSSQGFSEPAGRPCGGDPWSCPEREATAAEEAPFSCATQPFRPLSLTPETGDDWAPCDPDRLPPLHIADPEEDACPRLDTDPLQSLAREIVLTSCSSVGMYGGSLAENLRLSSIPSESSQLSAVPARHRVQTGGDRRYAPSDTPCRATDCQVAIADSSRVARFAPATDTARAQCCGTPQFPTNCAGLPVSLSPGDVTDMAVQHELSKHGPGQQRVTSQVVITPARPSQPRSTTPAGDDVCRPSCPSAAPLRAALSVCGVSDPVALRRPLLGRAAAAAAPRQPAEATVAETAGSPLTALPGGDPATGPAPPEGAHVPAGPQQQVSPAAVRRLRVGLSRRAQLKPLHTVRRPE